jgi:hypothetical protein
MTTVTEALRELLETLKTYKAHFYEKTWTERERKELMEAMHKGNCALENDPDHSSFARWMMPPIAPESVFHDRATGCTVYFKTAADCAGFVGWLRAARRLTTLEKEK